MIIKTLVENTSLKDDLKSEHGLSLYVETKKHRLLFDVGASGAFIQNAEKLGVDISDVDILVISHGHYDHGGGLKAFMEVNGKAGIYLHKNAFEDHFSNRLGGERAYIGLDKNLLPNERFVFVEDYLRIDDELELFSHVVGNKLVPTGNKDLLMLKDGNIVEDDFSHEQSLVIRGNGGKTVLLAGCAHRGILNISDRSNELNNSSPEVVIGGFHLYSASKKKYEDTERIIQLGYELDKMNSLYYTCHCTGVEAYNKLKKILGEKIGYLATGSYLTIE